jgi:antitoxin HigA-1
MSMHNPPHPGEFIKETYLSPFDVSQNEMADKLGVARSTFSRLIKGDSGISSEMALRLSKVIGRSPESWVTMQSNYDLYKTKQKKINIINKLRKFNFDHKPDWHFA